MPCNLSQNIAQDCFASIGGVKKVYVTEYGNIQSISVLNGNVASISLVYGKKFFEYTLRKQIGSFTEDIVRSEESGLPFYDAQVNISFSRIEVNKRNEIEKLARTDVIIIVVTNAGQNILVGHYNGLTLNQGSTATGTAYGDLSGYTLSFSGEQPKPAVFISDSFLPGLVNPVYGTTTTTTSTTSTTSSTTTTSTTAALAFDTYLEFPSLVTDDDFGVSGVVGSTNATTRFYFNKVVPNIGLPMSMNINLNGSLVMVVDFTDDYEGATFRFVSSTGGVYYDIFTNGTVNFTGSGSSTTSTSTTSSSTSSTSSTTTTSTTIAYNTTLTFVSDVQDNEYGVTATKSTTNSTAKLQFNHITPFIGLPQTMNINISSTLFMVVDFTDDYLGDTFRMVNHSGTVYNGTFTNGTINF